MDKNEQFQRFFEKFPHLEKKIKSFKWGSQDLDDFLNFLLLDTRNSERQGFDLDSANSIFELIKENKLEMEKDQKIDDVWRKSSKI